VNRRLQDRLVKGLRLAGVQHGGRQHFPLGVPAALQLTLCSACDRACEQATATQDATDAALAEVA